MMSDCHQVASRLRHHGSCLDGCIRNWPFSLGHLAYRYVTAAEGHVKVLWSRLRPFLALAAAWSLLAAIVLGVRP